MFVFYSYLFKVTFLLLLFVVGSVNRYLAAAVTAVVTVVIDDAELSGCHAMYAVG